MSLFSSLNKAEGLAKLKSKDTGEHPRATDVLDPETEISTIRKAFNIFTIPTITPGNALIALNKKHVRNLQGQQVAIEGAASATSHEEVGEAALAGEFQAAASIDTGEEPFWTTLLAHGTWGHVDHQDFTETTLCSEFFLDIICGFNAQQSNGNILYYIDRVKEPFGAIHGENSLNNGFNLYDHIIFSKCLTHFTEIIKGRLAQGASLDGITQIENIHAFIYELLNNRGNTTNAGDGILAPRPTILGIWLDSQEAVVTNLNQNGGISVLSHVWLSKINSPGNTDNGKYRFSVVIASNEDSHISSLLTHSRENLLSLYYGSPNLLCVRTGPSTIEWIGGNGPNGIILNAGVNPWKNDIFLLKTKHLTKSYSLSQLLINYCRDIINRHFLSSQIKYILEKDQKIRISFDLYLNRKGAPSTAIANQRYGWHKDGAIESNNFYLTLAFSNKYPIYSTSFTQGIRQEQHIPLALTSIIENKGVVGIWNLGAFHSTPPKFNEGDAGQPRREYLYARNVTGLGDHGPNQYHSEVVSEPPTNQEMHEKMREADARERTIGGEDGMRRSFLRVWFCISPLITHEILEPIKRGQLTRHQINTTLIRYGADPTPINAIGDINYLTATSENKVKKDIHDLKELHLQANPVPADIAGTPAGLQHESRVKLIAKQDIIPFNIKYDENEVILSNENMHKAETLLNEHGCVRMSKIGGHIRSGNILNAAVICYNIGSILIKGLYDDTYQTSTLQVIEKINRLLLPFSQPGPTLFLSIFYLPRNFAEDGSTLKLVEDQRKLEHPKNGLGGPITSNNPAFFNPFSEIGDIDIEKERARALLADGAASSSEAEASARAGVTNAAATQAHSESRQQTMIGWNEHGSITMLQIYLLSRFHEIEEIQGEHPDNVLLKKLQELLSCINIQFRGGKNKTRKQKKKRKTRKQKNKKCKSKNKHNYRTYSKRKYN